MLLTGPSGLDRAQVITVDIKIYTFRFSKWRTSSFSAVGPKNRAVTVHVDLVFIIMCAVGYQWGLSSSFLGEQFRRGCHSDAPLSCPHYGSCHSPSSHLTCSEPRSKAEPSFYFRACSSVLSHLRRASGMLQEQFMGFTAFLPLWDGHPVISALQARELRHRVLRITGGCGQAWRALVRQECLVMTTCRDGNRE